MHDGQNDGASKLSKVDSDAVSNLFRKARIASWAVDREALAHSAPDVILNASLGNGAKYNARIWQSQKPDEYAAALQKSIDMLWPFECEPTALPGFDPHKSISGVSCRNIFTSRYPRRFDASTEAAAFCFEEVHEEPTSSSTWEDDDGNTYSDDETTTTVNQLIMVTPRVAMNVRCSKGAHNDDDYNAELNASLYICEDPAAMQTLLRRLRCSTFFYPSLHCDSAEFEDKLQACFGADYTTSAATTAPRQ